MQLQASTINTLDTYWAAFFGCSPASIAASSTLVVPHAELGDYNGIWLFRDANRLVISIPPGFDGACFEELAVSAFDNMPALLQLIATPIERVIGPAWIGYADATTLHPSHAAGVRLLTSRDEAALADLRAACPIEDWEHGGSPLGTEPLVGYFVGRDLVALAGYEAWGRAIAHIAVVTHPAYRGRGYGKSVVSLLAETVLHAGRIAQYRTLRSNTPSMAIGAELGFVSYAEAIAIRLKREPQDNN